MSNLEAASESLAVFTPPIRLPKECEKAACLLPLQRGRITARTGIVASVRNRPSYVGVFALVLTGSRGQVQIDWDRAETMAIAFVVDNHRKGIKCIADAKGAAPLIEPAAATSAPVSASDSHDNQASSSQQPPVHTQEQWLAWHQQMMMQQMIQSPFLGMMQMMQQPMFAMMQQMPGMMQPMAGQQMPGNVPACPSNPVFPGMAQSTSENDSSSECVQPLGKKQR